MTKSDANMLFMQPLDVLVLRGNKLFADAGSHGEALMPPWPSVAAGALRSRILVDAGIDPSTFSKGQARLTEALHRVLGSVSKPGKFRISHFGLGRRAGTDKNGLVEVLLPMPADFSVNDQGAGTALQARKLHPGIQSSYPLSEQPTLLQPSAGKPQSGLWMTALGLAAWQEGKTLSAQQKHWVSSAELWSVDQRLGIEIDNSTSTAASGQLYTSEAVSLDAGVGFVARVAGADGFLPEDGLLRFGGDGHAASVSACDSSLPGVSHVDLAKHGRFRLMLTSPGIFPHGWRLPGMQEDGRWHFHGASARLASAVLPRLETVSGWDIARRQPKPALRVVPTGSVFWLDDFKGDPSALDEIANQGLPIDSADRRAEGFNNCLLAYWR